MIIAIIVGDFLDMAKDMKDIALSIPFDRRGVYIAAFHDTNME